MLAILTSDEICHMALSNNARESALLAKGRHNVGLFIHKNLKMFFEFYIHLRESEKG